MESAEPLRFEGWYRREHPRLVTLLAAAAGDAELARDAADEALARTFQQWQRVSRMSSPTAWTYAVGLNVARRHARRRAVERRLLGRRRDEHVAGPTGELWMLVADLPRASATTARLLCVDGTTVQVYEYDDPAARVAVSNTISTDGVLTRVPGPSLSPDADESGALVAKSPCGEPSAP